MIGGSLRRAVRELFPSWTKRFDNSHDYWLRRYRWGGNSGGGSQGESAGYKAGFVNAFVACHQIQSITEIGCGDGRNARLLRVADYHGYDISPVAIELARKRTEGISSMAFWVLEDPSNIKPAELMLSMDVIYHLTEDEAFEAHLAQLAQASRFILIYGTDHDPAGEAAAHVRHRRVAERFSELHPGWELWHRSENPLYGAEWSRRPHFMEFRRSTAGRVQKGSSSGRN